MNDARPENLDPVRFEFFRDQGFDPKCIVDGGASTGNWSKAMSAVFPNAEFQLFEPAADIEDFYAEKMQEAVANNPNFTLRKVALGAKSGKVTFYQNKEGPYGSTTLAMEGDATFNPVDVPVVCLADLIDAGEMPQPNLIKIDVQGSELEILKGVREHLEKVDFLLLETWLAKSYQHKVPLFQDIVNWLIPRGFFLVELAEDYRDADGFLIAQDMIFANMNCALASRYHFAQAHAAAKPVTIRSGGAAASPLRGIRKLVGKALGRRERKQAPQAEPAAIGSDARPIGDVRMFLEDVKVRKFTPRGILDVGANRGDWTRMALNIFPEAAVIMVEPQDEMVESLEKLCEEHPKVEFIKAGAAREDGELVQTIWEDLAGSSFTPEVEDEKLASGEQRKTKVFTIDNILARFPDFKPDFVKLDIQGFELEALRGGESLFSTTELFIVETTLLGNGDVMPLPRQVIQFMAERGYEIYDITEYLRRPLDGALGQMDIAFAKVDGILRSPSGWDVLLNP